MAPFLGALDCTGELDTKEVGVRKHLWPELQIQVSGPPGLRVPTPGQSLQAVGGPSCECS